MPTQATPHITTAGQERVARVSALYKEAFNTDPAITYMLTNLSSAARQSYLFTYFSALLTAAALNGAQFIEANDFSSCMVLIPPGRRVDNPWTLLPAGLLGVVWNLGLKGLWRMLGEYGPLTDAAKAKGLMGQTKYYYVFLVATHSDHRGEGLTSALLREALDKARQEGVPLWLEATTEYSWKLYASLGFETVEEIVLGKGVAAADGTQKLGGEGVGIWGMVWEPSKAAKTDDMAI